MITTIKVSKYGYNMDIQTECQTFGELEGKLKTIRESGFEPQKQSSFVKKPVELTGDKCPTCGKDVVWVIKKDGTKAKRCIDNKWDSVANRPTGCPYYLKI